MSTARLTRLLGWIGPRNPMTRVRSVVVCAGLLAPAAGSHVVEVGVVARRSDANVANPRAGEAGAYFPSD